LIKFSLAKIAGKLPMKQQSLASLAYEAMKKRTKREKFLKEMEQVLPWEKLIEPHYPRHGKGRPPRGLNVMLRIYCLQQWYGLSNPGRLQSFILENNELQQWSILSKTARKF
jgi:hypothetical protein